MLLDLLNSKLGFILISIFIMCALFSIRQILHNMRINQWQNSLNLKHYSQIFDLLYKDVNGFTISRSERQSHDAPELVYGEIEFLPFIALLSLVKPNQETVFYDLGSGTGKAVFACALVYPIKRCVGIELLPQLHASACEQRQKLMSMNHFAETAKKIEFISADYFSANYDEATMIFINSTALFGEIWKQLCMKIDSLPHLETVITTSKPLLSTSFTVILTTKVEMSWGVTYAFIHTRKTNFH